jgi:hypothetical protein
MDGARGTWDAELGGGVERRGGRVIHPPAILPYLFLTLAGCASMAASPHSYRFSRVSDAPAASTRRPDPAIYTVRLLPSTPGRAATVSRTAGDSAGTDDLLRIEVKDDDTLEYQLTIYNKHRRVFTSGSLYRGRPSPANLIATLFSGEELSSQYIQLRGTGLIPRSLDTRSVMSILRTNPGAIVVRIEGQDKSGLSLQGFLR